MTKLWLVLFMFVNGREQIVERESADGFQTLAKCQSYAKEQAKDIRTRFGMSGIAIPYGRIACVQEKSK